MHNNINMKKIGAIYFVILFFLGAFFLVAGFVFYHFQAEAQSSCTRVVSTVQGLQSAADSANPGDIICIRGGVYTPQTGPNGNLSRPYGRIIFNRSGKPGQPIIFKAYDNEKVIIDGQGRELKPDGDRSAGIEIGANYIILDGFEIRNFVFNNGLVIGYKDNGPHFANHIQIKNCNIHHNGIKKNDSNYIIVNGYKVYRTANGILIGENIVPEKDITISHCRIHHNGFSGYDHGVYAVVDGFIVKRSEFYANAGNGLKNADFNILVNGKWQSYGDHWTIKHNVFYQNGANSGRGLFIVNFPGHGEVYNNIFMENEGRGAEIYADIAVSHNLFYHNCYTCQNGGHLNDLRADAAAGNYFDKNPLFIDETAYDFHLQPNSPAIDAGKDSGEIYSGKAPDLGAYEYPKKDINGDGIVNVADLGIILSNWGRRDREAYDLDQDGRIGGGDAGVIIG